MDWESIQLTFWQKGTKTKADAQAMGDFINGWWEQCRTWTEFPLQVYDLSTAPLFIVDLKAWERDIERYTGEPETLYRNRVQYAYENAKDAGTKAGFERIWQRLELGNVEVQERIDGEDWDVVLVTVPAQQIADNPELLRLLIESYGRTCRRYYINTHNQTDAVAAIQTAHYDNAVHVAETEQFGEIITFNGDPLTINGQLLEIN